MINIYAHTFMTATRTTAVEVRDIYHTPPTKRRRWFSRQQVRFIDPKNL